MSVYSRKYLPWIAYALLFSMIVSALRIGVADLILVSAGDEMQAWSDQGIKPGISELNNLSSQLARAQLIVPDNPDVYESQARIALFRASALELDNTERMVYLSEGLRLTHRAISMRPVSSYSWGLLLLLKRERAEFDSEFLHAIERVTTLGPWERDVQLIVSDVGASAWAVLPKPEQEMVRENFVRGMKRQAPAMMTIVQSHLNDCAGPRARLNAGCPK